MFMLERFVLKKTYDFVKCIVKHRVFNRVVYFGLFPTAVLMVILYSVGLRVVETPSVPPGIWMLERKKPITRMSYVILCLPESIAIAGRNHGYLPPGKCAGDVAPLIKHIVALPGDEVRVTMDGVTVNNRSTIANSERYPCDHTGRRIPTMVSIGIHRVAPQSYWVLGDAPHSWDSRFFGPIPASSILGEAKPLIVGSVDMSHGDEISRCTP